MQRFILFFIFLVFPTKSFAGPSPCETINPIYDEISLISKKEFKNIAHCEVKNKKEIKNFITSSIELRLPKNKLEYEGSILKLLQLIPKNYSYKEELISLYNQQVAGFYDPYTKSYTIADWIPENLHPSVASHELVHVLQDQHYDLLKLIDKDMSTDQSLARAAAIEGDATFIMQEAVRSQNKKKSLLESNSVTQIVENILSQSKAQKGLNKTPQILKDILIFPYAFGLKYVFNLKKENNNDPAYDAYLKSPPNTTTEIIYPKHLLTNLKPNIPICPEHESYSLIFKDTLGEYFYGASAVPEILENQTQRNWNGDIYCVYSNKNNKIKISIISEWLNQNSFKKIHAFFKSIKNTTPKTKLSIDYPHIRFEYTSQ